MKGKIQKYNDWLQANAQQQGKNLTQIQSKQTKTLTKLLQANQVHSSS